MFKKSRVSGVRGLQKVGFYTPYIYYFYYYYYHYFYYYYHYLLGVW